MMMVMMKRMIKRLTVARSFTVLDALLLVG